MNKKQLNAFKNYNHVSFSMIPGLNDNIQFQEYRSQGPRINENYSQDDLQYQTQDYNSFNGFDSRNSMNNLNAYSHKLGSLSNNSPERNDRTKATNYDYLDRSKLGGSQKKEPNVLRDSRNGRFGNVLKKTGNNVFSGGVRTNSLNSPH